jgi:hypothetical protein
MNPHFLLEIPDFIEPLIRQGLEVTIKFKDDTFMLDLDLRAKSHMHMYKAESGWRVAMRYDEDFPVNNADDLRSLVRHAMHGRDYINPQWLEFLNDGE